MQPDPTARATDDDRDRAVATLTEQVGAGRLALQEFDERAVAAYAAETLGELQAVISDLTHPTHANASAGAAERSRDAGWHWARSGLICTVIWIATSVFAGQLLYFWPVWMIGPWGAVLLFSRLSRHSRHAHRRYAIAEGARD